MSQNLLYELHISYTLGHKQGMPRKELIREEISSREEFDLI